MDATGIVSANAGRARIFSQAQHNQKLEEVRDMVNTAARPRTVETESAAERSVRGRAGLSACGHIPGSWIRCPRDGLRGRWLHPRRTGI